MPLKLVAKLVDILHDVLYSWKHATRQPELFVKLSKQKDHIPRDQPFCQDQIRSLTPGRKCEHAVFKTQFVVHVASRQHQHHA